MIDIGQRRLTLLVARFLLAVALLICAAPAPVSAGPAPGASLETQETYEDAISRASTGDYAGAVIQLKNVLQSDPGHLPARIALGKYLLRQGQATSAEKELRIALRLGAAPQQVTLSLGNALLMQRNYQDILDTIKSSDPAHDGSLQVLVLRGRAHYELGQLDLAEESFSKASAKAPGHQETLLGLALVERARGRLESSLLYTRQAIQLAPNDPETWYQNGETLRAMGDSAAAVAAYDRALDLNPRSMRPRLSRAVELLNQGQLERARADARFVREVNPQDLMAVFIEWRALSAMGQAAEAKEAFALLGEGLTKIKEEAFMQEPYLLRLGAWFALARRDLARCERYLTQFVSLRPNDANMWILLGRVNLMLDDPKAAIGILHPMAKRYPGNLAVLSPLGQAYFKIGNYGEAAAMFERAAALAPNSNAVSAELALSRIGTGHWDDAMGGLKQTLEADDQALRAGLLLSVLQLKTGEREEALDTIKRVAAQRPNPAVYNLLGIMEAANGNLDRAREAFEDTVAMAPGFVPAEFNLAKLDLAEGNVASATRRLDAIVRHDPRRTSALLGLADIELARGDTAAAVHWLEKAVSVDPDNVDVQSRRVRLYLELGRNNEALNAANRMVQRKPENGVALETLAQAQVAAGKEEDARRSFRTAVRYAGFNGPQLMSIARQQVTLGDFDQARKTLQKASQAAMVATEAVSALISIEIRLGNFESALARIEELRKEESKAALAHILTGKLMLAQERLDDAIAEYEAGHELDPSTTSMLGLFEALDAAGRRGEAVLRLETWSAANPDDIEAQRKLALWYLPTRQLDKAKALHERLLRGAPNDPVLLSNLARLYQLEGDPRALNFAERAVAAKPDWPVALDTLGWILVTEGDVARGLEYLREAISRENNPLTRYHLAQALNEQGRVNEAKVELRRLLNSGWEIEWMDDVQKYYDGLAVADEPVEASSP